MVYIRVFAVRGVYIACIKRLLGDDKVCKVRYPLTCPLHRSAHTNINQHNKTKQKEALIIEL